MDWKAMVDTAKQVFRQRGDARVAKEDAQELRHIRQEQGSASAYHELKLALDAHPDPTLSKGVAPVTGLQTKIKDLGSSVKGGNPATVEQQVTQVNDAVGSIGTQSASSGQPIPRRFRLTYNQANGGQL
ncbi:MAG: hypothetical protein JO286_02500 [Solirubrobacterales bacterium]|nr:hypothetical protein [Solirubrobacterales bacterium]